MKRALTLATLVGVLFFGLACGAGDGVDSPIVEQATLTVEQRVGAIAKAVDAEPSSRDDVLLKHGMTADEYEAALYEIAMDAARTRAYEKARQAN